jgi:PAS domain S-box-containing protein
MLTVYEPDTKIARLNPAFERAVSWSTQDAAGVSLMEQCYPDPAYREHVREFMQSCRGGSMDIRMRTRDGRDLETAWAKVRLSDGTQAGIGIDITGRKRHEQALQDADRRKDEFLATLAHELRNPLAPIRNAAQILSHLGHADPTLTSATEIIARQVQHLTRLVDDLLDVSRITRGKVTLRKEPVDLATVVTQAIETSRPLIESHRHELTVSLPGEAIWVEADLTRLAQVIANLLTNAAKYTPEGGHIRLTVERDGDTAIVRVRDDGVGISGEMLTSIFDLFTQGDRSLARSEGGLGIGLTLVKRLVEMHGGSVIAYSDGPGRGSEFIVRLPTLPAAPSAPADTSKGGRSTSPSSSRRRILVVDDNVDAADSLAMLLGIGGHEVRTAHDGATAVEVAKAFQPEVVLLDIGLPGMDGYEVARQLRGQLEMEKTVLVAVTGYGQDEDRRRTQEAGFDEHLVMPVDPVDLERLLRGFI